MVTRQLRLRSVKFVSVAIGLFLTVALVGCTPHATTAVGQLEVSPASSLMDEPLHIRVTGLGPGQRIELTAADQDLNGTTLASKASFTADAVGVVDLDRDAPVAGDYTGVDGMGLIASMAMQPDPATPGPPARQGSFPIRVAVTGGPAVEVQRVVVAPDVTQRSLSVATDGVAGELMTPAHPVGPGVLLIGGSEGGISMSEVAAVLASRGYPALAVGYFHLPGLPNDLRNIPIEYFATAARLLPGPVRVLGDSRGSEAAMLLAGLYPSLVSGTVLASPAAGINPGFPNGGNAWTFGGAPVTKLPFDTIAKPVLAFAGTDDLLWFSATNVTVLRQGLGGKLDTLVIDGAGHDIFWVPYQSFPPAFPHPVTGQPVNGGGTRLGNEQAHRQTWARFLSFLAMS
jgi:pimeloyl-ACP methyl ester carboxylesterase